MQTLVQVSGHARRPRVLLQVCRKPMNYFSYRSLKRPLFHLRSYAAGNVSVSRSPVPSVVAPSLKYAETLVHNEVVTSQSDCVSSEQHVCSREIPSAIPSSRSAGLNMYATSSAGTPNQIFSPMQPAVGASMPHVVTNGYSTCSTAPYNMAPPVVLDRFDGNIY